ncbi:hypothetical protein PCA31118_03035 [Pandoraea captiosa]|uniref:Uncharacterized protein n=1 Tax=Pandoraea captiosa TaxID=2508302 RepID=A0A5E5A6B0_9BURK|nr:hypothetical protein [Pandoraea captiosa]VVE68776.1 hypothetical protein PCA31118_03035 [Pandoraea captiosa]
MPKLDSFTCNEKQFEVHYIEVGLSAHGIGISPQVRRVGTGAWRSIGPSSAVYAGKAEAFEATIEFVKNEIFFWDEWEARANAPAN